MTREARQDIEAREVAELMVDSRPTLVIHPGALGDVLLAVPALRALRGDWSSAGRPRGPWVGAVRSLPNTTSLAGRPHPRREPAGPRGTGRRLGDLAGRSGAGPAAPLVLAAQPKVGRLLGALGEIDDALDFEGLGLGALFVPDGVPLPAAVLGAGRVISWFGAGDPTYARRLADAAPGAPAGLTIVARPWGEPLAWQHLARSVGAADDRVEPIAVPEALVASGRAALARAGWDGRRPVLMVQPGSGGAAKRWPADGFARCLARVAGDLAVVVHRGPADAEAADALVAALGRQLGDLAGLGACVLDAPELPALAGVLAASTAVLGNDSGVSHLAAALGTPACVLFAPDKLAWRPWGPTARVVPIVPGTVTVGDVERVSVELAALLSASSGASRAVSSGTVRARCAV